MQEDKGTCEKHKKEFTLTEGCPQCLEESRQKIKDNISGGMEGIDDVHFNTNNPEDGNIETAVALRPGEDVEARGYFQEAMKLLEYAEARVIATADDAKGATDDLSLIAKLKRSMEEKRRSLLGPLKTQSDAIRDTYYLLMEPILNADKITREKMLAYDAEQRRIRQEQEEIARMEQEAAERKAALTGKPVEAPAVEVVPLAPKTVETAMGVAGQRVIKKYRVVDFALLPDQYKIENSALLNKVVKAGIPAIPGVEIYEEPILTVRAR